MAKLTLGGIKANNDWYIHLKYYDEDNKEVKGNFKIQVSKLLPLLQNIDIEIDDHRAIGIANKALPRK